MGSGRVSRGLAGNAYRSASWTGKRRSSLGEAIWQPIIQTLDDPDSNSETDADSVKDALGLRDMAWQIRKLLMLKEKRFYC